MPASPWLRYLCRSIAGAEEGKKLFEKIQKNA